MPDAWIVLIPPHPEDAIRELKESSFWNALLPVREKRVLTLGSINPYGALPAAGRFADLLTEGLVHAWNS
jgi:iron complex transport system substrate-binding protein